MKRFFRGLKEDFKHPYIYIGLGITVFLILISVFYFSHSYVRIWQACKDLISSFTSLGKDDAVSSVTLIPDDFYSFRWNINVDWNMFAVSFYSWWWSLWNMDTFSGFFKSIGRTFMIFMLVGTLLVVILLVFYLLFKRYFKPSGKENNHDSLPLKCFHFIQLHIFQPVKNFVYDCFSYIKFNKWLYYFWFVILLLDFNVLTICLEFFAYYFYFLFSYDFVNLYIQLYKLIGDISPILTFVPAWIVIVIFVLFRIHKRRINNAYSRLQTMELKDKQFVSSLGVSTLVCGEMGIGKTSTITDMALSCSQYFRQKAFEKILQQDLKFPDFPWVNLESELLDGIQNHSLYTLASVRSFIREKRLTFEDESTPENCFSYDLKHFPSSYYDGKCLNYVWDVIETYSLLFFIYCSETSLILSNYSIREDNIEVNDFGKFPLWDLNFFRKDYFSSFDRHSHILDFDMTRLGLKVSDNDLYSNALEFGVVVITEGGKERLNALGTKEMKSSEIYANQKNDRFELWLKMYRHSATVDNFCFGKVFIDEQRPMSLGADLREVCQNVIFLHDEEKNLYALSLHTFGSSIINRLCSWFRNNYYQYKHVRGDNTLFMYLVKSLSAYFIRRNERIKNTFGYSKLSLEIESGSLNEKNARLHDYFLCYHKIYSNRYDSGCFGDFFYLKASNSDYGLNDLPTYDGVTATVDELKKQNSYFINDLTDNVFFEYEDEQESASSDTPHDVNKITSFKTDDTDDQSGEE